MGHTRSRTKAPDQASAIAAPTLDRKQPTTPGWPDSHEPIGAKELREWLLERATWFRKWDAARRYPRPFDRNWQEDIIRWMATSEDQVPDASAERRHWAEEKIFLWWDNVLLVLNAWFDAHGIRGYPLWRSLRERTDEENRTAFFKIDVHVSELLASLLATTRGMENGGGDGNEDKAGKSLSALAVESVDAAGYVTDPADPSAYLAASEVRLTHTPAALATTHKRLLAILSKHPDIKRWRPRKNRLSVHLADWLAFVKRETEQLDGDGLLANQFEVEARTAKIRRKKSGGE